MTRTSVAIRSALALALLAPIKPALAFPANLQPIADALEQRGWTVLLKAPPRKGIYGMANSKKKTIWVHPITEAMGIMPQTFVHEAVHAAQSCPNGTLTLIGVQRPVDPAVGSRIRYLLRNHYKPNTAAVEQEAFVIQSQPDAEHLIITALDQRCSP